MSKDPLSLADFKKGWMKVLEEEDQQKLMPIHPLGSVRIVENNNIYCKFCHRGHIEGVLAGRTIKYSKLCFGKRRWWFFGKLVVLR